MRHLLNLVDGRTFVRLIPHILPGTAHMKNLGSEDVAIASIDAISILGLVPIVARDSEVQIDVFTSQGEVST